MPVIGIDLGGTKLATALFTESGELIEKRSVPLAGRKGAEVGSLIEEEVGKFLSGSLPVSALGVSVPGISRAKTGTVWAPNIEGWEDFPLRQTLQERFENIRVSIDSDRACAMLGELWQGNARGCRDAIFFSVGTGIGAGILADGRILRGAQDIAGAIGWMALDKPFREKYIACGCFEYYASGDGIARFTRELLAADHSYAGSLKAHAPENLTAHHVFKAYDSNDEIAQKVFSECIQYWGMGVANLISIFNPEKIIFSGGVFGPALRFLGDIREEARKWAQPISMQQVLFEASGLHGDAAIFGAGYLALNQQATHP